jgi:hypothetical protein
MGNASNIVAESARPYDRQTSLRESDVRNLEASWITPELAQQAKLHRVTNTEGAAIVGLNGRGGFGYERNGRKQQTGV